MTSALSARHFHDEKAAYAYVEKRIWPQGPVCPHCGGVDRLGKLEGKSTRVGTYKCYQCRKPFTVKIGTIFESSHVPMHIWLQAMFLIAGSKKGISSNQLHRTLGVTLKTAWFMSHRIREAMRTDGGDLFGTGGGMVEVDETYIGVEPGVAKGRGGYRHKMKLLALVDRRTGGSRAFVIDGFDAMTVSSIMIKNISREAQIMTDEAHVYRRISADYAAHHMVAHAAGEYVRGDLHTNTIEGYFSIFKRGMKGVYQFCGKKHLHRYAAEFSFRYTNRAACGYNDAERADILLGGIVGKRLTYQTANRGA